MKRSFFFGSIALAVVSLLLQGCGSPAKQTEQTSSPTSDANESPDGNPSEHGEHGHGEHGETSMEKMKTELAKLSPEDAASAEKQHFCPVTGEMLGSMGAPKKIEVNGQQVWICCDGCKDKLLANPDKYLAKLKNE